MKNDPTPAQKQASIVLHILVRGLKYFRPERRNSGGHDEVVERIRIRTALMMRFPAGAVFDTMTYYNTVQPNDGLTRSGADVALELTKQIISTGTFSSGYVELMSQLALSSEGGAA